MKTELEDRSQYIRTMAKDMATLAGTPQPPAHTAPAPAPAAGKGQETFSGVTLEKQEQPFFERPHSKAEDRGPESLALPSLSEASSIVGSGSAQTPKAPARTTDEERASILERLRQKVGQSADMTIQQTPQPVRAHAPSPEPVMPEISAWPAPDPKPPVPQAEAAAPATPVEPARPTTVPVQAAPIPLVEPIEQRAPSLPASDPKPSLDSFPAFSPSRSPEPSGPASAWPGYDVSTPRIEEPKAAPAVTRETYREPIEPYVPPARTTGPAPDTFHTYTTDFANRIDSSKASAFSVLAAEQDAAPARLPVAPVRSGRPLKTILALGTGVVLLVLAGGGVFLTYQFVTTMRNTPIASLTVPSIVFADEYRQLEGSGSVLMQALAAAGNGALVPGNVLVTYLLTDGAGDDGKLVRQPAGGAAFMRALMVPAPDILLRNIADESTVGVIDAGSQTRPFFALRVDSYERTYAGMLTWEPLMARDLSLLYPLYPEEQVETVVPAATSTATTTASTTVVTTIQPQAIARTRFEDAIVANHDVRVLRDTAGKALMLYGYADKRTLLIARDEAAFEALLARLKSE